GQSPVFIGGVGSEYGGDAVSLRVTGLNPQSVSFFLQEETCGDAEVLHGLAEEIHYWVFNEPGSIQGRLSENAKKPVADVRLFSDDAEIPSGLFPNPVSIGEDIFLDLGSSDASYITLINSSGVVMNKQKLSKEKDRLNLNTSSLSKGLYYLVVYSGRSERQHKVLIQ
ncbi:MAG: T9SS type A sorting domain-containing protein, partial [Bacteroidota bacterium]